MTAVQSPVSVVLNELVRSGVITFEEGEGAIVRAAARAMEEKPPGPVEVLVQERRITGFQAVQATASCLSMAAIDLADMRLDPQIVNKLTADQARKWNALPFALEGNTLRVAVIPSHTRDLRLRDDIERITKNTIEFVLAEKGDLLNKINSSYRSEGALRDLARSMGDIADTGNQDSLDSFTEAVANDPLVKFVHELINQAIRDGASDLHIEPTEFDLRVRFRIDGVLKVILNSDIDKDRVVNRLKILANMDIGEHFKPQDGRMTVPVSGGNLSQVELRVNSLPTVWGEKIVMRILDNTNAKMTLPQLGFSESNLERYSRSFTKPHGMILVTGPTGSGKSTTLYATINKIITDEINVVTVEDPVEYRIDGISQVQVNVKQGRTFPDSLRAILRQDPDVILIGEIRDAVTAEIAITAALTGHLVLATLHTNDAASAVTRLTEMGVEPYLIGDAVEAVIAQRLIRKLCTSCRVAYHPSAEEMADFEIEPPADGSELTLYKPGQCQRCVSTGYRGRVAVHEVMLVDILIANAATARVQAADIASLSIEAGMTTLKRDATDKALAGLTSLAEVRKISI